MKIEKIKLQNFRCFGADAIELNFEEVLTTLVGGNGSGKTAVLQAVSRLFGTSSAQRALSQRISSSIAPSGVPSSVHVACSRILALRGSPTPEAAI